jgi:hypothetical protein
VPHALSKKVFFQTLSFAMTFNDVEGKIIPLKQVYVYINVRRNHFWNILIFRPIKERRKILQKEMIEIPNRILFSEMKHITVS